jgi:ubiquinol-cytochrome c reductase cytochrome b subunit
MNYSNIIGFILFFIFILQFLTGVLLSNYYSDLFMLAFNPIVYIMIEINNGWLIRIYHILFGSLFMFVIFIHYIRGIWIKLRNQIILIDDNLIIIIWISGFILFILILVNAVIGYILVWGQMSHWGLQVMLNIIGIIPFIGLLITELIWCNSLVILNRMFSIHWLIGLIVVIILLLHIILLHNYSSSNVLFNSNTTLLISFFPYLFKDFYSIHLFLLFPIIYYFLEPDYIGNSDNNIIANPLITPLNIIPESYLLFLHYIIRSVINKTIGVIVVLIIFACFFFFWFFSFFFFILFLFSIFIFLTLFFFLLFLLFFLLFFYFYYFIISYYFSFFSFLFLYFILFLISIILFFINSFFLFLFILSLFIFIYIFLFYFLFLFNYYFILLFVIILVWFELYSKLLMFDVISFHLF